MIRKLSGLLIVGFLLGCQNQVSGLEQNILDEQLLAAYSEFNESTQRSRSALLFDNDQQANTCESYWTLVKTHDLLETIENQLIKSEYLICDGLFILSEVELFPEVVDRTEIGAVLRSKLDLRSFPSSLKRLATEDSFTLASLFPEDTKFSGTNVVYDAEDWVYTLRVVAVLNINDNSDQDWLVQLSDEAKVGNYRSYSSFILYDVSSDTLTASSIY
ncbi:hypothetical protein [Litoribrevibacter albus]|uniref:Lipoprotein n=1 Tax=Litoribrevibacter albus TaxID=1473156 RepID=A0AA37S6P4_9GAMM|nr:hypothetical protein [Litoribrevibacter albus]GLQ30195.1 hypothetical protein GCM10007876_06730 [Litoribrevibacter albus]